MNSCIVVADFGGCEPYCFDTLRIQQAKYVCKIDFERYLNNLMNEFKKGPQGPTVVTLETPYFSNSENLINPWGLINEFNVSVKEYYFLLLHSFFKTQYDCFGVDFLI